MEEESVRRRESMRYGNRFENRAWRPQTAEATFKSVPITKLVDGSISRPETAVLGKKKSDDKPPKKEEPEEEIPKKENMAKRKIDEIRRIHKHLLQKKDDEEEEAVQEREP